MKDFKKMGVLSQQGEKWKKIEVELERKHILVVKSIEESGNQKKFTWNSNLFLSDRHFHFSSPFDIDLSLFYLCFPSHISKFFYLQPFILIFFAFLCLGDEGDVQVEDL